MPSDSPLLSMRFLLGWLGEDVPRFQRQLEGVGDASHVVAPADVVDQIDGALAAEDRDERGAVRRR